MKRTQGFNYVSVSGSPSASGNTPALQMANGLAGSTDERCMPCDTLVAKRGFPATEQINHGWQWLSRNTGRRVLVVNAPEWLDSDVLQGSEGPRGLGSNGWTPVSTDGLVFVITPVPQRRSHMLLGKEDGVFHDQVTSCVGSLSPPIAEHDQRELTEFIKTGNLQALIDEWGDSNIEELEAFIDSYLEMVLKESVESALTEQSSPDKNMCVAEACHDVLSSVDRKLSKLSVLEGMQRDMQELKHTLELNSKIMQDLMDLTQTAEHSGYQQAKGHSENSKSDTL